MAFFLVESLTEPQAYAPRAARWEHVPEHDILLVYLNL